MGTRLIQPTKFRFRGQISGENEIGRWIELLSSLSECKTIVEIGTWNGLGSTKMILRGLRSKETGDSRVIGFESNRKMYRVAKRNLRSNPCYELILGSIVYENELDTFNLSKVESGWIRSDIADLMLVPYVFDSVPNEINLLILDGGEFSTFAEFTKLNSRVTDWIVLDDIKTRKCERILKELPTNGNWEIIFLSNERNGTAVLKRLKR